MTFSLLQKVLREIELSDQRKTVGLLSVVKVITP